MSEFIIGPLWTFSVWVFCIGVIGRIGMIVIRGSAQDLAAARGSGIAGAAGTIVR